MEFHWLNELILFAKKHRGYTLLITSLLISTSFFIIKNQVVSLMGIEISALVGQPDETGIYNFGDYTYQVNHLVRTGSLVEEGKVLNRYTPGYPLLLYGTFVLSGWLHIKFVYVLFLVSAFFIACSTVIIGEIAFLVFRSGGSAIMAGLLYATHPYMLQGLSKVMSVTPFMTFFYLALLVWLLFIIKKPSSPLHIVLTGFLLGLAMLIRPIALFLPLIFMVLTIVFLKGQQFYKRLVLALALVGTSVLTISPWQRFNARHGQEILLSSDEVHSMIDGVWFNDHPDKLPLKLPADVDALSRDLVNHQVSGRAEFFKMVFRQFRDQPLTVIKMYLIKAARSWYGVFGQDAKKERLKLFISGFYLLLFFFALFRIDLRQRPWKVLGWLTLILVLYFWAMTVLVVSMARYMYPVFGLMVVFIPGIFNVFKHIDIKST